jgi:adenosylcobinamide-GDP ribazoletransferase
MDEAWLRGIAADLKTAVLFATRIPLPHGAPITGADFARASWALPVAGLLIGLLSALAFWLASYFRLPPFVCATLAVAVSVAVTGGLHEDGLADAFDGLGGATREDRLDIMRDSRLGTYGACALVLSLLLRIGALASLAAATPAARALIAAHAGARAMLPLFLRLVPAARSDGLAADAGRPPTASVAAAVLIGLLLLLIELGTARSLAALLLLAAGFAAARWLASRLLGGQTGDVAGALEQAGEIAILLVAASGHV